MVAATLAERFAAWPWWARAGGKLLLVLALTYLFVAVLLYVLQRRMVFPAGVSASPLSAAQFAGGLDLRDVTATTGDGLSLHGWLGRASGGPSDVAHRNLVLYLHGNGGDRRIRLGEIDALNARGWDVLLFDYRGYGENPGSPSEIGLKEDGRAFWRAARDLGYEPHRIVVQGVSLGGGVAVPLVAERCAAGEPPAGLMLRSTFDSLANAASNRFPWLPVRALLKDPFDSAAVAEGVTCPVFQAHGTADRIVPLPLGRRLHAAFPADSADGTAKRLLVIEGANHNGLRFQGGAAYGTAEREFLNAVAPPVAADAGR